MDVLILIGAIIALVISIMIVVWIYETAKNTAETSKDLKKLIDIIGKLSEKNQDNA